MRLASTLDPRTPEFRANAAAMAEIVADLRAMAAAIALGGGTTSRNRHVARGKLLPRERIDRLLDEGSPFLELSPLAGKGLYGAFGCF